MEGVEGINKKDVKEELFSESVLKSDKSLTETPWVGFCLGCRQT